VRKADEFDFKMWSYGEVLLPLPDTSRRIDIRDGSPPSDQVKYVQKCGGLDLANGSSLLWRNDDNKLELMQFHPQEQGLNESVTIAFPRNVQVLPSVALYESGKNVLMVVASQASLHLGKALHSGLSNQLQEQASGQVFHLKI
jgi:hypothetical protein